MGRFLNLDDPMIALQSKSDPDGMNLYTYCNNDPVNKFDPTGYWGADVHKGFTYNKKTKKYTVNSYKVSGKKIYYGTYWWARQCGFGPGKARTLARYCNDLDDVYPSSMYATAIAANATYAKNNIVIYSGKELDKFWTWQYYHFNGYKSGKKDTRIDYSKKQLKAAVKEWKKGKQKNKVKALQYLGYGLHAIQDIEAHGQIGRGLPIPQHIYIKEKVIQMKMMLQTILIMYGKIKKK